MSLGALWRFWPNMDPQGLQCGLAVGKHGGRFNHIAQLNASSTNEINGSGLAADRQDTGRAALSDLRFKADPPACITALM